MQALSRNKPAGGMPPQAPPPGPAGGGMMIPQKPAGQMENGKMKVHVAIKMLEQALAQFGAIDKEGKSILTAITSLAKTFGKQEGDSEDLLNSEKKTIAGSIPGGAAPPGAPPGGAPPGPPGMMPAPGGAAPPQG
jgi:hypothetical protein